MRKKGIILIVILAVLFVALQAVVMVGNSSAKSSDKNVTVITAPDQDEPMENELFKVKEFEKPEIEGKNVALNKRALDNGYNDVYDASLAVDGLTASASYWEGSPDKDVNTLTVNLKDKYNIHTMVLALNPDPIWGKRTQTFSISVSNDGKKFTELVPSADYDFDPNTGNMVLIDGFKETKAQYVQVNITDNTGATAGQIAELEVYSNDK